MVVAILVPATVALTTIERLLLASGWRSDVSVANVPRIPIVSGSNGDSRRAVALIHMTDALAGPNIQRSIARHKRARRAVMLIVPSPLDVQARLALEQAFAAGLDEFVVAEALEAELPLRLAALSRRAIELHAPLVRCVGDLKLNRRTRRLRQGKNAVSLTPCEYRVFSCLATRPGQAVSRVGIQRHLMGHSRSASTNLVDVYVLYLRRKLAQLESRCVIRTIRGTGYCLTVETPPPPQLTDDVTRVPEQVVSR